MTVSSAADATDTDPPVSIGRVLPLYLVVFIGFVGYSLMITVFTPLILGDEGGMIAEDTSTATRTLLLGALLALYPLAQFLGSPVIGALSDRFGRRQVLMISLVASACCYVLIALALEIGSLPLLMLACALAGFSEANTAIAQSAVADIAPASQRSRLFGYVYLATALAYVIGPLAGGKLASWLGFSIPFWGVAVLLAFTLVLTAFWFRETHTPAGGGGPLRLGQAFANLGNAFAPGPLRALFLGNFVLYLAIFGFFRVYPMYLVDQFGMGISKESEFIAWVSVPFVIANLGLVAWLARKLDPRRLTVRFALALAVCLAVVVIPNPEWALWPTLFACAMALSICLPSMAAMISQAVDGAHQGSALGANQSLQVGAEGVSGLAGGGLASISTTLPMPVLGGLALLGAGLLSRPAARRARSVT